ncbi:hypothetical protein EEZ25_00300 [Micromonospora aurantiaca]|nr:hypothetical protein EEZ25_00300 [Micromonospora aurantiaca]
MILPAATWILLTSEPAATLCSPFVSASNASSATVRGSSVGPWPTRVPVMPARSKNSVSAGPSRDGRPNPAGPGRAGRIGTGRDWRVEMEHHRGAASS